MTGRPVPPEWKDPKGPLRVHTPADPAAAAAAVASVIRILYLVVVGFLAVAGLAVGAYLVLR